MKIKEYKVVTVKGSETFEDLNEKVNSYLKQGWVLHGGITHVNQYVTQVMVLLDLVVAQSRSRGYKRPTPVESKARQTSTIRELLARNMAIGTAYTFDTLAIKLYEDGVRIQGEI